MANKDEDITSLNKELMSFDFSEVSVEELERRLELALASIIADSAAIPDCKEAFSCGATFSCRVIFT